ncbi:hypothetical protein B5V00_02260 [Geothermobacter hydrogeniphilus]|uniref:M23ase beta-sheet core domain-containing protein n=1 Tax=Geothermobacter hydrogeniphilus TaxID=1969733 RepID=A0A1X0YCS1_9BACT|nr:hypothetical protein B5V00_02260 [Geothermobacter hydrogeniphilus]
MVALRFLLTGLLLLLFFSASVSGGEKLDDTRRDLQQLQQRIKTTNRQLAAKQAAARKLVSRLHRGDAQLRAARQHLQQARRQLALLTEKVADQQTAVNKARKNQRALEGQVRERLRVLYKGGDIRLVKVLFSARSPAAMAEEYHFLQRMVRHDRQLLEDYRRQVRLTETELKRLAELQRDQQRALAARREREKKLRQAQRNRQQLLARVRHDEEALAVLLHELEEKAARLSALVKKLEQDTVVTSAGKKTGFAGQRGRLPWPVRGPVRIGFGTGRHPELGTRYDSHGIEIGINGETPIKAVWDGSVIFAKPFRGYGNLLIIDHGDGYYSLYAQASRLLRKAGDRVERGEAIAVSGFEGSDVVYFEIRKGGTPQDPLRWLTRRHR